MEYSQEIPAARLPGRLSAARPLTREVASIHAGTAQVLTFDPLHGVGGGIRVHRAGAGGSLPVDAGRLGFVALAAILSEEEA